MLYIDVVYDSTTSTYWANIEIDDLEINSYGFYVDFGTGWEVVKGRRGNIIIKNTNPGTTVLVEEDMVSDTDNIIFITGAASNVIDPDESLVSIQIAKTENYSINNSNINFVEESMLLGGINTGNSDIISTVELPYMYRVEEFILGDVNTNNDINASDASTVLNVVANYGNLNVYNIRNSFLNYFPNSLSAAVADVTKDGYITNEDAMAILSYYSHTSAGASYNGDIGKTDLYEVY